jgi:hypothetical protein
VDNLGVALKNCLFAEQMPGGRFPTRAELALTVDAGRRWARERDLPDPAGWQDLADEPERVWECVTGRLSAQRFPLRAQGFPLPKPGAGLRELTWLDPYDEAILRVLIGRTASTISRACDPSVVFSYPVIGCAPAWRTEGHSRTNRRRREAGARFLEDSTCAGLGLLDVRNYYPSVRPASVARTLVELGAAKGAAMTLANSLEALTQAGAPAGLPLGFEGSGLLGNAYLLQADRLLRQNRIPLIRYTDDTWLFLGREADWGALRDEYAHTLRSLGLELNLDKSTFSDKAWGDPWRIISRSEFDYVAATDAETSVDHALTLLAEATSDRAAVDHTAIRFALGALQYRRSPLALPMLEKEAWLVDETPIAVADYLVAIAETKRTKKAIDRDWVLERSILPRGDRGMAGQLHACRVAAQVGCGPRGGERLLALATDASGGTRVPLRCWAATAWAKSSHWSADGAVQAAEASGDFSLRRAFVLPLRKRRDKATKRGCKHLLRIEPDLSPTLSGVTAA